MSDSQFVLHLRLAVLWCFFFFCRLEVVDDLSHHTHLLVSIPPVEGIGDPVNKFEILNFEIFITKVVIIYFCL